VTHPVEKDGLGFSFKWNMGWMNDILSYIALDPIYRQYHHDKITFSMMYAFSEHYVLPFSHDEVVHCKGSMIDKQPGDLWQKFASLRALYGYYMVHPGKKLLFMGAELGQEAEWDFATELRWKEATEPENMALTAYFREANRFYLDSPELWELDFDPEGFLWLAPDEAQRNIVAFMRMDEAGNRLYCAFNFSGIKSEGFRLGLPEKGEYRVCFSSERAWRAGKRLHTQPVEAHGQEQSALLELPPLSAVFFRKYRRSEHTKTGKENLP
jgi:1,4-alpha-glucan branching enzyme